MRNLAEGSVLLLATDHAPGGSYNGYVNDYVASFGRCGHKSTAPYLFDPSKVLSNRSSFTPNFILSLDFPSEECKYKIQSLGIYTRSPGSPRLLTRRCVCTRLGSGTGVKMLCREKLDPRQVATTICHTPMGQFKLHTARSRAGN